MNVLFYYIRYYMCPVADGDLLLKTLEPALGVKGKVVKDRKVYLIQWDKQPLLTARVHLDRVKDLGDYLEFEV